MALPAIGGALALLTVLGLPIYEELVAEPRARRAERRTRRSEAADAAFERYLMEDEERRVREITSAMAADRQRAAAENLIQIQTNPQALGVTMQEMEMLERIAYRPRASPAEMLAFFGMAP